ncbi:MAG TPA: aminoglycoside adenylyltransferase domain-containing protein [Acidimicrobiales bacterium]|nr:aminoglycoside adenylyltransferase domain-containing protein [Acidimicrobiales bacterium]
MHETVGEVTRRYLRLVDELLPERVEGLYLVGSVALDDFQPGVSDIDFVAVTKDALTPEDLGAIAGVHHLLRQARPEPAFDGIYVTWDDLARDPAAIKVVPHHDDELFHPAGGTGATPLVWLTLRTRPVAVRGPDGPEVWVDEDAVARWARADLETYWRPWVERQQTLVGRGTMKLADGAVMWGVLSIPRLHRTLATGEVGSKSLAAEYALATFGDDWAPIVREALRLRRGGTQSEEYRRRPLARRRDALDFMAHVLDDALTRHPTP